MRLRNRIAAALLVFALTTPTYAAVRDGDGLLDKFARLIARVLNVKLASHGDGAIPPIPPPKP
jgi:hypothetical protein